MAGELRIGRWVFDLWQDGSVVASVQADYVTGLREINHYAMMYASEGPIKITERCIKPKATRP